MGHGIPMLYFLTSGVGLDMMSAEQERVENINYNYNTSRQFILILQSNPSMKHEFDFPVAFTGIKTS